MIIYWIDLSTILTRCYLIVPNAVFIEKNSTPGFKDVPKIHLSGRNIWQGCQVVNINVSFDRFAQHLYNEVLFDGSGRHFYG